MSRENCISILGLGLSNTQITYKNVLRDIEPEERSSKSSSFTYEGEEFKPNSAERYNLELRKSCQMQYFPVEELIHKIRTRDMACAYAENLSKVVAYLTAVMELANDVNNQLKVVIKNTKSIKHNSTLSKEEKTFEIAKSSVSSYVDILVEIKARIIDLENSDCNYNIQRTYTNLDTQVKTMMETSFIPDELAENFNMLYENYPLHKFSNAKDEGFSRTTTESRFIDFSRRLYSATIKVFIFELLEEFYPYITPRNFLNNPQKKALFVIPPSFYAKFNFFNSGLTREEMFFLDAQDDMEKTTVNLAAFLDEVMKATVCMQKKIQEQKNELFDIKDEQEIEMIIDAYTKRFSCSAAESNIRVLKKLLKNDLFREKLTVLLYELRADLIVNKLKHHKDPWDRDNVEIQGPEENALDEETTIYLYKLMMLCFGSVDFKGIKVQLSRVIPLFADNEEPQKSLRRYFLLLEKGKLTWSDTERGKKFREALER